MKKNLIFVLTTITTFCFAQHERSRKFELDGGLEYRITPFHFKKPYEGFYYEPNNINFNKSEHLSGLSINIGLNWFFLKNTSLGLIQSFRYDDMVYEFSDNQTIQTNSSKKLIYDTEIHIKHYFQLKNNDKIFATIGYAFMNNNTEYVTKQNIGNPPIEVIYNNFLTFDAIKIGAGYQYKNFESSIGLYFIEKNGFPGPQSDNDIPMGIPFLKLSYKLAKF